MPTLITADLHLSDNIRDAYRFDTLKAIRKIAADYGCEDIFILGDLTEAKDRHGAWLTNKVVAELQAFTNGGRVLAIMQGNHDALDPHTPFFEFVDKLGEISWISEPTEFEHDILGLCLFLPHTSDYKRDWAQWIEGGFDQFNYIFAHNTFEGARSESNSVLKGIPVDVFPADANVIAGDIHRPQRVGPVEYVGSPYHVDFGDRFTPRILIAYADRVEEVRVPGIRKIVLDTSWPINNLPKIKPGDMLKLRVTLDAEQVAEWAEIKASIHAWGVEEGFVIASVAPITERERERVLSTVAQRPDREIVEAYAHQNGIDEKTLAVGLTFIEE